MIEIIPAIMPKNFGDLKEKMALVSGLVPLVQIDVMDGFFVPSKSWPYNKNLGAEPISDPDFATIIKEEGGFPFWEELDFEADLMVSNPEKTVSQWISAGAKRVILHIESLSDPKSVIKKLKESLPVQESFLYTEIGLALNPETPNEKIEPFLEDVDFVQFMGIQKIGFQGEQFNEIVLTKIADLRAKHSNVTISVDGGVNLETAPQLIKAGVNRLAIGSAIFGSENVSDAIQDFFEIAM